MPARRVRKRCARCGRIAEVPVQQRHCHQPRFGRGSYSCWGALDPVERRLAARHPQSEAIAEAFAVPLALIASREELERVEPTPNDPRPRARRLLAQAQEKVDHWIQAVADDTRRLKAWQQKAKRYARQAALSDAEIAALSERGRRAAASKGAQVVRALKLTKGGAE